MKEKARKVLAAIGALVFIGGLAGLLILVGGRVYDTVHHAKEIEAYRGETLAADSSEIEQLLASADEYNRALFQKSSTLSTTDAGGHEDYMRQLTLNREDSNGLDTMAFLEIPTAKVALPVYHGTDDNVLQQGIGHVEGSSLPVGGPGTHAVLTGHSGLPSKKLFTNLERVKTGDTFTITTLSRILTYEVDSTVVCLPEQVQLSIHDGQDECTLITCTPVGVNTHRLVVHGHRVATPAVPDEPDPPGNIISIMSGDDLTDILLIFVVILAVLLVLAVFALVKMTISKRRRKKKKLQQKKMAAEQQAQAAAEAAAAGDVPAAGDNAGPVTDEAPGSEPEPAAEPDETVRPEEPAAASAGADSGDGGSDDT